MQRPKQGQAQALEFGARVRGFRNAKALSQEQLAEAAGLHRTYIGHIERGEVNVALFNIVRVADALGVDPAKLVTGLTNRP